MGMVMSSMGMPSTQMFNLLMGTLYNQFTEKEINTFDDFHQAFLDIFNTVNSALPGRHYDTPSRKEVEECYYRWGQSDWWDRKGVFVEFMKKTMNLSRLDNATMVTGIVTPPAAMAAKKAGENVPQMNIIKAIPDVIFVPSVTLIALITAKLSRKIIQRKKSSYPTSPSPSTIPEAARPPSPRKWSSVRTKEVARDTPSPQNWSSDASVPHHPSLVAVAAPLPSPPPAVASPSSSQPQPSIPAERPSWTWYTPIPQPGFTRTRQPQRQDSSSRSLGR